MKKIKYIILLSIVLVACTKDLEDLNKDIKNPETVTGESLFSNAQKNLWNYMTSSNVNDNIFRLIDQYWTETTYTDESNYDLVTRTIPDNFWDHLYKDILKSLNDSKNFIKASEALNQTDSAVKTNKLAIIDILEAYTYCVAVETFGDVPYSEAFNPSISLAKYDDAFTIYVDLLKRLSTDVTTLNPDYDSYGIADNIYQGEVSLWIKFANSLRFRMGMHLSDIDPELARTIVEEAATNMISSNAENARMTFMSEQPNTNPIYVDLVASGRKDFVPSRTIIDTMNNLADPRMFSYFTSPLAFRYNKIDNKNQDSLVTGTDAFGRFFIYSDINDNDSVVFKNPPYTVSAADSARLRFFIGGTNGITSRYSLNSHINNAILEPTFPASLMDYSEVELLLAEAVERGFAVGTATAKEHYDAGITASMLDWNISSDQITSYLANPLVDYSTAWGNYKMKIGRQLWIALYNRGFEGWTEYRRLDYPTLYAPPGAKAEIPPRRFTYPIEEQTVNGVSYNAATQKISGGDLMTSPLFWDVKSSPTE